MNEEVISNKDSALKEQFSNRSNYW